MGGFFVLKNTKTTKIMKIIATKTKEINGEATPPASKSEMIRGLILGTLAKGTSALKNPLHSQDTIDAIRACRALGAVITVKKDRVIIESNGIPLSSDTTLNTGNSGVTTHFLMPVTGLRGEKARPITFDCGEQMKERPVESLVIALQRLGMSLHTQPQRGKKNGPERLLQGKTRTGKGKATQFPFQISGELLGGKATVSGVSSQYLSALLMSLPCAKNDSIVTVEDLQEKPYVEMTEGWLREQGIKYVHKNEGNIDIYSITGRQEYQPFIKAIPGDFSSASYIIAAGVLFSGTVTLHGLDMQCSQGDKELVTILKSMGADIRIEGDVLTVTGGKELAGTRIDANAIPDMVPTLAVIGTQAKGKTEIYNVTNARLKETDRLHSMKEGLSKMGANIEEKEDGLTVRTSELHGASVHGFDDHRTVMALSLAGMLAEGDTTIDTAESINKTFPDFVTLMQKLGGHMKVTKI